MAKIDPSKWLFVRTIGGVFLGELVEKNDNTTYLTHVIELTEAMVPTQQGMRAVSQLRPATPALSTKIGLPRTSILFDYPLTEVPRSELAQLTEQLDNVIAKIRAASAGLTL